MRIPRRDALQGVRAALGLELDVTQGAEHWRERYTFFDDGGEWKLWKLEKGTWARG